MIDASTALTYAWVTFLDVITSTVVATASGRATSAMADRIKMVNQLIAEETSKSESRRGVVTDEKHIVADLISVDVRPSHTLLAMLDAG